MIVTTRFAPSPTGYLHLGHAYAALFAHEMASPGQFLLRIEDIDPVRSKALFTDAIIEDLHWLGLAWNSPFRMQSHHAADYAGAFAFLYAQELLYPCFCTRKEIDNEVTRSASAPHSSEFGYIYPGICRHLSSFERREKLEIFGGANWRLDLTRALKLIGNLTWHERGQGLIPVQPEMFGDVVLARKDIRTSYHLSVTVDDHLQGITLVTRGRDLFPSTHIHRILQKLLGYEAPEYCHHALIGDASGKRYAKRDQSHTLQALRHEGLSPADIKARLPPRMPGNDI